MVARLCVQARPKEVNWSSVTEPLTLVASRTTSQEIVLHPGGAILGRAVNDRRLV